MSVATLVIEAGRVHTMDEGNADATHIAIAGNRILAVGSREQIAGFIGSDTVIESFPGATVTPGWSDGHSHPVWGLQMTAGVCLLEAESIDEVCELLRGPEARVGRWITGWGLNSNVFPDVEAVHGSAFDEVAHEHPLYLRFRDGHSALANAAAFDAAAIQGEEEFAGASRIVTDSEGRPTGHLLEMPAMARVEAHMDRDPLSVRAERLHELLSAMADRGLTSVQALDCMGDPQSLCTEIERHGELPLRLRFSPLLQPGVTDEELGQWIMAQGSGGRRWRIEGIKLMLDGTVEGGTAWMERPDIFGQNTEPLWLPPQEYQRVLLTFVRRGIPTATHAIGDRAVEFVLDTLASVEPAVRGLAIHRIEHIETLPESTVAYMASLGVVASVQPIHSLHLHEDGSDNWSARLGHERASRALPNRALAEAGVPLVLGSDWPVADFDPLKGFAAAVERRARRLPEASDDVPDQSIERSTALQGYTSASARVRGEEEHSGRIRAGFDADLTVFADDPLTMTTEELRSGRILATVVGGCIRKVDHLAPRP